MAETIEPTVLIFAAAALYSSVSQSRGPKTEMRMEPARVAAMVEPAGLKLVGSRRAAALPLRRDLREAGGGVARRPQ
jgi:hypothetical protein